MDNQYFLFIMKIALKIMSRKDKEKLYRKFFS